MFCANCGKEQIEGSKFCPICGTKVGTVDNKADTESNISEKDKPDGKNSSDTGPNLGSSTGGNMVGENVAIGQDKIYLKTEELTSSQKLFQVYWALPESWRLDEFILENEILTIKTKNGNTIQSHLSKITSKYAVDQYGRHEFFIEDENGKKLHFKEIPDMLSDEDWELIKSILPLKLGAIGKINNFARVVYFIFFCICLLIWIASC